MGHDTEQVTASAVMERLRDGEQVRVVGLDAGAVAVAVNLDQHVVDHVLRSSRVGNRVCRFRQIQNDLNVCTLPIQIRHPGEFLWRDADRIENVPNAVLRKVLGFFQRRDGYARILIADHQPGDIDGFGGFEMWPQGNV